MADSFGRHTAGLRAHDSFRAGTADSRRLAGPPPRADEIQSLLQLYGQTRPEAAETTRRTRLRRAIYGLARHRPEYSARNALWTWQIVLATILAGLLIGQALTEPGLARATIVPPLAVAFAFVVAWRLAALGSLIWRDVAHRAVPDLPDAVLPRYTALVPLYQEAGVVPGLLAALDRIDYPRDRLEVLLILEDGDSATRAAVDRVALPVGFRTVIVPDGVPRTKPKALVYAFEEARGDYVVVYDAEDIPDPLQLRAAAAAFAIGARDGRLGCVQAPLDIDARSGPGIGPWLTRQFALEYAALFHGLLPVLAAWRVPVPLGGTSNHFSRQALADTGGWDPFNVTEDADLGVRLARHGWRVGVIARGTREEAPDRLDVWLRQRTRWLKGFMQTYAVHMRRPRRLLAELGAGGFVAFHVVIGGVFLNALVQPIVYAIVVHDLLAGTWLSAAEDPFGRLFDHLAVINLVGGTIGAVALPAIAGTRLGIRVSLILLLTMPIYWLLASISAYRGLYQLATDPHLWEKTPHTPRFSPPP